MEEAFREHRDGSDYVGIRLLLIAAMLACNSIGCAAWFGEWSEYSVPGDGYKEVIRKEGRPHTSYEVDDTDFVWVWNMNGKTYKRAWMRWEPFHDGEKGRGLYLVRMDYDYHDFMEPAR